MSTRMQSEQRCPIIFSAIAAVESDLKMAIPDSTPEITFFFPLCTVDCWTVDSVSSTAYSGFERGV